MTSTPSCVAAETALILCLAAGPLAFGAVEPWSEALVFMLAAVGFLSMARGSLPLPSTGQATLIGVFCVLAGYSFLQSLNPVDPTAPAPLLPHTVSRSDSVSAAFRFSACAAAAWLSASVTKDRAALVRFSWAILSIGAVIALIGLLQLADGNSHIYGLRGYQSGVYPFGPFYNRNHAGALLSLSCFAGVGVFLDFAAHRRELAPRMSTADFSAAQSLVVFLILLTLAGLAVTGSRGAVAAAGFVAALWALSSRGGKFLSAGAAVGFVVMGLAVSAAKGGLASSVAQRISLYLSTSSLIGDAPIFGRGFGAFARMMPAYQHQGLGGMVLQAHSDPLQMLAEGGLVAVGVSIASLSVFVSRFEGFRSDHLRASLAVAGAAFVLQSFVDFGSQIFGLLVPVVAVLAASSSVEGPKVKFFGRGAARGLTLALFFGAIWMGARTTAWVAIWRASDTVPLLISAAGAASQLDADPRYRRLAAAAHLEMAAADLTKIHRLRALAVISEGLSLWPLDARALALAGRALGSLGREADASVFLEKSKRASF